MQSARVTRLVGFAIRKDHSLVIAKRNGQRRVTRRREMTERDGWTNEYGSRLYPQKDSELNGRN
jgi:hypothetical protein